MPLATISQVKAKLKITSTNQDSAIQAVLDAVDNYILDRTGYVLSDISVTEYLYRQPSRVRIYLQRRPVADVQASARLIGDTNERELQVDVIDATAGVVVIAAPALFPPPLYKYQEIIYDVMRITYTAQALTPIPVALSDAAATLAAYWYRQQQFGPSTDVTIGPATEKVTLQPIPPAVEDILRRYERRVARWC